MAIPHKDVRRSLCGVALDTYVAPLYILLAAALAAGLFLCAIITCFAVRSQNKKYRNNEEKKLDDGSDRE